MFLDPGLKPHLLELRKIFDKYFAFEVVNFMLHADRQQAIGLQREGFAFGIQRTHSNVLSPPHFFINAGHRQTAFLAFAFTLLGQDFRVDKNLQLIMRVGNVDHNDLLVNIVMSRIVG